MKTLIIASFASIALIIGSTVKAQMPKPITLGVKAGVALSTTSVDEYDITGGLATGVVVDFNFSRNLFIRSGLDFMMKGGKLELETAREVGTVIETTSKYSRVHLNYLQLPVMIGYRTPVSPGVNLYAAGGLYAAYGIYASGKYQYTSNILNQTEVNDKYDNFKDLKLKKFDFGVVGSIGVEYGPYSVNVGYEYGFINANKTDYLTQPANFTNGDSWHNMNATCTLGYRF